MMTPDADALREPSAWLDSLLAYETPAMRWLRLAGPIAQRLNREAAEEEGEEQNR